MAFLALSCKEAKERAFTSSDEVIEIFSKLLIKSQYSSSRTVSSSRRPSGYFFELIYFTSNLVNLFQSCKLGQLTDLLKI